MAATTAAAPVAVSAPAVLDGAPLASVSLETFDAPFAPRVDRREAVARPASVRLRSGFVPAECHALWSSGSPRVVDCWLDRHPRIAQAIRWEFAGKGRAQVRAWPEWDDETRQAVRDAFLHARRWRAGGMKAWPGATFQDPPDNQEAAYLGPDSVRTVLDGDTTAWPYFTAQVGLSLAAELEAWVPWSLRNYDAAALADLFDAPARMYTYDRNDKGEDDSVYAGYGVMGSVTPAHPTTTFRFFAEHRLLGSSPIETITATLEWSRKRMVQAFRLAPPGGADDPARAFHEVYWQYPGKAPLGRLLSGTRLADSRWKAAFPEPATWTAGCAMTTDAFVWMLRTVNIPTRRAGSRATCGHSTPFFSGENLYLSHADDPYSDLSKTASFSAQLLLVRAPLWQLWFASGESEPWCSNVGRRVLDLNVRYPSDHLVGLYCADALARTAPADGQVLEAFRNVYTFETLQKYTLWERLEERAQTSTAESCTRWRAAR